jgi:hypothetical protein
MTFAHLLDPKIQLPREGHPLSQLFDGNDLFTTFFTAQMGRGKILLPVAGGLRAELKIQRLKFGHLTTGVSQSLQDVLVSSKRVD